MNHNFKKLILLLFLAFISTALFSISTGSVKIPISQLFLKSNEPIFYLRLFRIIIASAAGCGLAVSGIALQAILKNPLAEPYLLGTSSGAGLGAVIAVTLGLGRAYLPPAAFVGAIISIAIVYNLASQNNRISSQSLILSGVIVSVALSAVIVFLISISSNEALHGLTWWLWGSFQVYDPKLILIVCAVVLIGILSIYIFAQDLNAISIGEEEAMHLGINVESVKKALILITALITASLVCICGIIGFIGLIIPHMMRTLAGPNHKKLIPITCLAAPIFMMICDTLSRIIYPPLEVPIGVMTALVGTPVFIFLLKRNMRIK